MFNNIWLTPLKMFYSWTCECFCILSKEKVHSWQTERGSMRRVHYQFCSPNFNEFLRVSNSLQLTCRLKVISTPGIWTVRLSDMFLKHTLLITNGITGLKHSDSTSGDYWSLIMWLLHALFQGVKAATFNTGPVILKN